MAFNIAIDGPAGAGKSTIAKKLAADLGYVYVDTGAMYRAMAYYFLQNHIDASDEQAIAAACPKVDVTIQYTGGEQQVILNKENVNGVIRKEEVGNMASATSVYPVVRTKLVELQRQLAAKENVIMDGRDIGTNILPDALVACNAFLHQREPSRAEIDQMAALVNAKQHCVDHVENRFFFITVGQRIGPHRSLLRGDRRRCIGGQSRVLPVIGLVACGLKAVPCQHRIVRPHAAA